LATSHDTAYAAFLDTWRVPHPDATGFVGRFAAVDVVCSCQGALDPVRIAEKLSPHVATGTERAGQVALFFDVFGPAVLRPLPALHPKWLAWKEGLVRGLAEAAYEERCLPEGTLDPARLVVLADALEEAGCTEAELLGHLRGSGPHVRGCWALDVVLEKE
jgi:hypothetical protein